MTTVCADFLLAEIMGYPVKAIPYLAVIEQEGLRPGFERVGVKTEEVSPEHWKKPSYRIPSLFINLMRILAHHRTLKKVKTEKETL